MNFYFVKVILYFGVTVSAFSVEVDGNKFEYPAARRDGNIVDNLHGRQVSDPYRWLENPDTVETMQFITDENKFSQSFLSDDKNWQKINEKLTLLWNYSKFDPPERHGKYYFSTMNTGLQNQKNLYKQSSLNEEPSLFIDLNSLSPDGTVALDEMSFSKDGSLLAYSLSISGSDWTEIRIRNVETAEDYPELLQRIKFPSVAWTKDNKGFFYCRYDPQKNPDGSNTDKDEYQKLYYHRVGESQDKDVLVVEFTENPSWAMSNVISDDGRYLIVSISEDLIGNGVYFIDLKKYSNITGRISLKPIVYQMDHEYYYVTNNGSKVVFFTNRDASNFRMITIDFDRDNEEYWETLVEEDPEDVLLWAQSVDNDKIVAGYIHDVKTELRVYSQETGKLIRKFALDIGTVDRISGCKESSEIFFKLESFLTPGTIYRYDFSTPDIEPTVYREAKLNLDGFDKNNFNVDQVFYPSDDGTKIPMFIVQKKTEQNGPKATLLHGYGGFGSWLTPLFDERFLYFMNNFNGILAIANIRGGGEYGRKWYDSGRVLNKQNSYIDFQAAAKYLVAQKYTESKRIGILGASNGGLLVGACLNQRPDLFGAAVPQVGVMDLLRFHKFTVGAGWISDYGNPEKKIEFENLFKISPLHNVRAPNDTEHQYPSTLIITADHDDRVSPLHSLKFAATLQHELKNNEFQTNPILLRVYSNAGHGAGKPIAKAIEEATDISVFLYRSLHIDDHIEL